MKPIEIYNKKEELILNDINLLKGYNKGCNYDHIPEVSIGGPTESCRVQIKVLKHSIGRMIASVWFDDKPVMVVRNDKREDNYFSDRYITNKELYKKFIEYINSMSMQKNFIGEMKFVGEIEDVVDQEDDIEELNSFFLFNQN